ncbi:MAG: hypothetical protein RLZZ397_1039 [Pseudomonadota bacterium]
MEPTLNIAAVERDTGLSKDVLRMWERRYGFPEPRRDDNGERLYSLDQVERLRLMKRLMDLGHRPGKLMGLSMPELEALSAIRHRPASPGGEQVRQELRMLIDLIRQQASNDFSQAMHQRLARQGLQHFIEDTVAPLTTLIGEAWESGELEVYEEHLFTELTKRIMRQAISALPPCTQQPRVLLTTVPDEPHLLGLLMVEALLTLEGVQCIPLGSQTPLTDIVRAVQAHRAEVVALSFSMAFPHRQIAPTLTQIRQQLPDSVEIWAGGSGVTRASAANGVRYLPDLSDVVPTLKNWRQHHLS